MMVAKLNRKERNDLILLQTKEDKQKDNGIMMAGKVTSFDFKNFSKYYDNVYKKGISVKKIFPDGLSNKVLQQFLDKANKLSKN